MFVVLVDEHEEFFRCTRYHSVLHSWLSNSPTPVLSSVLSIGCMKSDNWRKGLMPLFKQLAIVVLVGSHDYVNKVPGLPFWVAVNGLLAPYFFLWIPDDKLSCSDRLAVGIVGTIRSLGNNVWHWDMCLPGSATLSHFLHHASRNH